MSFIETRDFRGIFQFREKGDRAWRFYVSAFSGDGKTAHVQLFNGGLRDVPITRRGYLVIDGRRFGPRRWDH